LFKKSFWVRFASRRAVAALAVTAVVCMLVGVVYQEKINDLAQVWELTDVLSARVSMEEGSSGKDHVLLIKRGLETWLTSPKTFISGIGIASAPKVLADFFGEDKHGNFHSLYVTILAELGLPAFVVLIFLLSYPIIDRRNSLCCAAAIMIFNVSYQSHMEPVFWVLLALLWSYERRGWGQVRNLALASAAVSNP
jgi:hypothetical protein